MDKSADLNQLGIALVDKAELVKRTAVQVGYNVEMELVGKSE